MEQNSFDLQEEPTARRSVLVATILCTLLIISLAIFGGLRLYDWARWRIVQDSLPMAEFLPTNSLPMGAGRDAAEAQPAAEGVSIAQPASPSQPLAPVLNVLLLGTDARSDDASPPRTDTIILLTLDPNTQTAGMLSLPRDLWVPIPEHGPGKINMAYWIGEDNRYQGGGAQLVKDTVSQFIGQAVPYYVRVNFQGFIELTDLIDGVDVMVEQTIHDEEYPTPDYGVETFHLDAGLQHLDGETALKYARTRHTDSDFGRAHRQQALIRAVLDKVLRADMIPTLLPKALPLLSTMSNSIETDIPIAKQLEMANYLRQANLREIRQLVLDDEYGEGGAFGPEGAWILKPDRARVRAALATFFSPAPQEASSGLAMANPSWVRIEVLNGTDQPGVAARTRDLLTAQGWQVVAIGDADRSDYGRTLIINYGVPQMLVEKVSADLNLQPNLSRLHGLKNSVPIDVRIVVGQDILPKVK